MAYGFKDIDTSSFSSSSSSSNVKGTCWVTVTIIVGVLLFILIVNDLFMRKQLKCKKIQKNVKFYDEDNDEYERISTIRKSSCSLNH
jgi:hypothetical protein